jgi:hypothetical protein
VPSTSIACNAPGTSRSSAAKPSAPTSTWQAPAATSPATAADPLRRPPVSALPSTNAMSMPGTITMPNTSTKNSHSCVA